MFRNLEVLLVSGEELLHGAEVLDARLAQLFQLPSRRESVDTPQFSVDNILSIGDFSPPLCPVVAPEHILCKCFPTPPI